jgi:biopolymer transport protein ExbB
VSLLEDGLDSMAVWISVAPLLGLLGTVVGMIKTFTIITEFGVGNPNLLADGISVALLTTQAGLTVSFPSLLFHVYLKNRKERLVKRLILDAEQLLNRVEPPHA